MVYTLQHKVGASVDDIAGPKTFRALQAYLGTYQDGLISAPGLCVMELQRRLNSDKF